MPLSGLVPGTQAWILCPKIELMLTMCPTVPSSSSRFFISRTHSRVTKHKPMMFVSIVRYNSTVFLASSKRPLVITPALFISKSTPPHTSSIHLKAAATWFSSRMSHSMQLKNFLSQQRVFRTACGMKNYAWKFASVKQCEIRVPPPFYPCASTCRKRSFPPRSRLDIMQRQYQL